MKSTMKRTKENGVCVSLCVAYMFLSCDQQIHTAAVSLM
jgi:hypothetical protein